MSQNWMIYGATGYTGQLIIEEALRRGHKPLLAGRSEAKLRPLADQYGLPAIAFDLDTAGLFVQNSGIGLVVHAAGPFSQTAAPMVNACLRAGVHYLDITGEIDIFEANFARHAEAQARGIAIISGVGFDVVPTDCLARYVVDQLGGADKLVIAAAALESTGGDTGVSRGTAKTSLEMLAKGSLVRRDGRLLPLDLGMGARPLRYSNGERLSLPVPLGDLSTGFYGLGVPNITAYMAFPPDAIRAAQVGGVALKLVLRSEAVRRALGKLIDQQPLGPGEQRRLNGRTYLYARAERGDRHAEAWMETAEGYHFTAQATVRAVERVLAGGVVGALSPAQALGADFPLDIDGTRRLDQL